MKDIYKKIAYGVSGVLVVVGIVLLIVGAVVRPPKYNSQSTDTKKKSQLSMVLLPVGAFVFTMGMCLFGVVSGAVIEGANMSWIDKNAFL